MVLVLNFGCVQLLSTALVVDAACIGTIKTDPEFDRWERELTHWGMWNDGVDDLASGLEELTLWGGWEAKDWGRAGIEVVEAIGLYDALCEEWVLICQRDERNDKHLSHLVYMFDNPINIRGMVNGHYAIASATLGIPVVIYSRNGTAVTTVNMYDIRIPEPSEVHGSLSCFGTFWNIAGRL
ncbi:hypothetical protein P691DRAFT_781174 [Macrolepiota fuliginosa MF-IS2]|uniref:Uncharacterized protein n=1 Tax=Macrolepiota fuliginosa MF-IS2 TaxID=1400762 RepID=A0A9P5X036_9AGAR|nr:hypothetical protein P691DRAFT_781174 [Macrolepiota fuliginosa MF-IS2]